MGKWKELAESMTMKCDRCGEVNPAEIHTCSPQEPVAWFMEGTFEDGTPSFTQVCETDPEFYVPLYTAPPQREWQGLTEEERRSIREWQKIQEELGPVWAPMMLYLYEAIETKLKEKNT